MSYTDPSFIVHTPDSKQCPGHWLVLLYMFLVAGGKCTECGYRGGHANSRRKGSAGSRYQSRGFPDLRFNFHYVTMTSSSVHFCTAQYHNSRSRVLLNDIIKAVITRISNTETTKKYDQL